MSYAMSAALQSAVYQQLLADSALSALVGSNVFDAPPSGTMPRLYVVLGSEKVRDASDATGTGAWHDLTVAVITQAAGFQSAKETAAAVSEALHDADLALSRGRLVSLRFLQANARRTNGGARRIDLTFRARVEED